MNNNEATKEERDRVLKHIKELLDYCERVEDYISYDVLNLLKGRVESGEE